MAYACPVLFGLDTTRVSVDDFAVLCHARAWLASLSFTVAFGAVLSKTYRVHRIFNTNTHEVVSITDLNLVSLLLLLLLVDVLVLLLWSLVGGWEHELHTASATVVQETYTRIYQQWDTCTTSSVGWLWGVVAWKGSLLAGGAWLAVQVRHVHIPALNDSRWVGFSIYNLALLSAVTIPVGVMLSEEVEAAFVLVSMGIILMATSVVLLLFLPKMLAMWTDSESAWTKNWTNSSHVRGKTAWNSSSPTPRTSRPPFNSSTDSTPAPAVDTGKATAVPLGELRARAEHEDSDHISVDSSMSSSAADG